MDRHATTPRPETAPKDRGQGDQGGATRLHRTGVGERQSAGGIVTSRWGVDRLLWRWRSDEAEDTRRCGRLRPVSTIAVLGPGGVGGFVAATLSRAGEAVVVVARDSTVRVIDECGIAMQSEQLGNFTARPDAVAALGASVDVLLVTTKANTLPAALERIKARPGLVVPLLNGLEHMDRLRERFGPGVVAAGVIRIESDRPAPARIVQTSPTVRVDLAADDPALAQALARLAATLERAGGPPR